MGRNSHKKHTKKEDTQTRQPQAPQDHNAQPNPAATTGSGQEEVPRVEERNADVYVNDDRQREATAAGDGNKEYDSDTDDWVDVEDSTTRELAQARFAAEPTDAWFLVDNETDEVTEARARPANATHDPEALPEQHLIGATLSSGGSSS